MPADDGVPDLIPARMLNQFAYCERLFFLEFVTRQWADSGDVAEGLWRHRRVDKPTGAVPLPFEGTVREAMSVELASENLGISARLDLLRGTSEGVVPVDTKKGSPRPDGSAWEPDAIQVCAQVLLLREHGYLAEHGEIYYAATCQRVTVAITPELLARTLEAASRARALAANPKPPPPLRSSPKCPRCSLAGICLPDEVNVLTQRQESPPRRLIAAAPDAAPLYITEPGTMVGVRRGRLVVSRAGEKPVSARLMDVLHVAAYGNVQLSAHATRALIASDIDVFHFTGGGWLLGLTTGLPGKNVALRMRQVAAAGQARVTESRRMIGGKIRNCRVLLRRNGGTSMARVAGQLLAMAQQAEEAETAATLLGIEGSAARVYFTALPEALTHAHRLPGPAFTGLRNRRPPLDAVNCLLSFCYALLVKETLAACMAVGLDPFIGLYHRPRFGRPALALDLAEEFRPLFADSTVLTVVNNHETGADDFLIRAGAVGLTADGRRAVIKAWERRMRTEIIHPRFGYKVTARRAIELQARFLAATLTGELPHGYEPMVTR